MTGGIPPQRPDQAVAPPPMVISAGGAAGVFRGRLVLITNGVAPPGSGIFFYDNTGNLIGEWVASPGTDPINGSSIPNPGITLQNATVVAYSTNIQPDGIVLEKFSGLVAPPSITLIDNTASAPLGNLQLSPQGILFDGWHTISLDSGWSTVGGQPVPSYKLLPDGVNVEITGVATHTSFSANTNLASGGHALPTAYRPTTTQVVGGQLQGDAALEITTAGVLVAAPGALASATACRFNGTFPIDL